MASPPRPGDGPGSAQAARGASERLTRRLGTADAVMIGLGSMIGAGVFAAFGPAARVAGTGLLVGLVIAAVIAYCNAVASAQLAAVCPTSGGTYIYGRERLGRWWGFIAGWGFVVGKTASCAAMALTFACYAVPGSWWAQRAVAVAGVLGLAALNYRGVTKTALLTRVLVVTSLTGLTVVIVGIAVGGQASAVNLGGWSAVGTGGAYGIVQAAGLLFFAFAGYARIATMGEEVRDPQRTIPRAIPIALLITVAVYLVVGVAALVAAGPDGLATASAPLTTAVHAAGAPALAPVVRITASLASLGALLALIAGIGVLVYYAIANVSAFTQPAGQRRWPRWLNLLGVAGCLTLVATLPWQSVIAGLVLFAIGIAGRVLVLAWRTPLAHTSAGDRKQAA